jgi:hypothetical protein
MRIKFHINSKSNELLKSILVEGGLALDVFFATSLAYFLTFASHFANTLSKINDTFFSPMCLYTGFESLRSLKFFI